MQINTNSNSIINAIARICDDVVSSVSVVCHLLGLNLMREHTEYGRITRRTAYPHGKRHSAAPCDGWQLSRKAQLLWLAPAHQLAPVAAMSARQIGSACRQRG